jgi:hypothetical protein
MGNHRRKMLEFVLSGRADGIALVGFKKPFKCTLWPTRFACSSAKHFSFCPTLMGNHRRKMLEFVLSGRADDIAIYAPLKLQYPKH